MSVLSLRVARFAVASLLAAGCADGSRTATPAAAQPSQPTIVFPRRDDLAKLPSLEAPREAFAFDAVIADLWTFAAPVALADDEASYQDPSAWEGVARDFVRANRSTRLSPALRCAAAELARFYVERGGMPTESLRRFTVARCGGASSAVRPLVYRGDAPEAMTDAVLFEQTKAPVGEMLKTHADAGRHALGLATARSGKRFAVVALLAADEVRLEATPRAVDASRRISLRGVVRSPAAEIGATINRGDFASNACERDRAVALPQFAFSCRLDDADKAAWVQISVRRNGRLLEDPVADLLAYEGDPAKLEYKARASGTPAPIASAAAFAPALLTTLNRVRAAGKLPPLTLAEKQSAEATRLTGTLVDALLHQKDEDADRIVLGLLAGWEVGELIRNGGFFVGQVAATRDANAWLDYALERPMGRVALLDPKARRIAIGAAMPEGASAIAAAVTTYQLFDGDHDAESARIFARATAAREDAGLAALPRLVPAELRAQADLVREGKREPMAALDAAMHAVAQRMHVGVSGHLVETNDLEHVTIPDVVLRAPAGSVAIEVTHHRAEGAAWGQYVVFYLVAR